MSLAIQQQILGASLRWVEAARYATGILERADFTAPINGAIFCAIRDILETGQVPDPESVRHELALWDEEHSDALYIATIAIEAYSPSPIGTWCKMLREESHQRRRDVKLRELLDLNTVDPEDARKALQDFARLDVMGVMKPLIAWNDINAEAADTGVTTGFSVIDKFTRVGYVDGQVTVVSAYHKGGKTSFKIGSFLEVAKTGVPVVFGTFSDLNPKALKKRALKNVCGVGGRPITRLDMEGDYDAALALVDFPNVKIYYGAVHGRDVETFAAYVRAEKPRIFFADYAQKIRARSVGDGEKTRQLEYVSGHLSDVADELNIPGVIGSQITSDGNGGFTTKYARALEEDAGMVLRIKREDGASFATVEIPYNRFGPSGTVQLAWNESRVRFEECGL